MNKTNVKMQKKDLQAERTLIEFKEMIKEAEENEDILYGQNQMIAFMLEDLDEKRFEEFLKDLEQFRAKVELKKKKKNCLDTLGEIQEMVEIQKDKKTVTQKDSSDEPPKPQKGRKLHATKF